MIRKYMAIFEYSENKIRETFPATYGMRMKLPVMKKGRKALKPFCPFLIRAVDY